MYFFIQGTTALILILAANTGYSAFPCWLLISQRINLFPECLLIRGDRLGYSNGIMILGISSIILIIVFKGRNRTSDSIICSGCIYSIYIIPNRNDRKVAS